MKENTYMEALTDKNWESLNGGEKSAVRMYGFSKRAGYDVLVSGWGESAREDDAEDFVKTLRESGIREFYFISDFSNQLSGWLALDKAGLKLCGICEIENPEYVREVERYGSSDQDEKIPALKFVFEEELA